MIYTGLRVSPICGIKVGDISFAPPTIRALVKGSKVQVIKMYPALVEPLKAFITQHRRQGAHAHPGEQSEASSSPGSSTAHRTGSGTRSRRSSSALA